MKKWTEVKITKILEKEVSVSSYKKMIREILGKVAQWDADSMCGRRENSNERGCGRKWWDKNTYRLLIYKNVKCFTKWIGELITYLKF